MQEHWSGLDENSPKSKELILQIPDLYLYQPSKEKPNPKTFFLLIYWAKCWKSIELLQMFGLKCWSNFTIFVAFGARPCRAVIDLNWHARLPEKEGWLENINDICFDVWQYNLVLLWCLYQYPFQWKFSKNKNLTMWLKPFQTRNSFKSVQFLDSIKEASAKASAAQMWINWAEMKSGGKTASCAWEPVKWRPLFT